MGLNGFYINLVVFPASHCAVWKTVVNYVQFILVWVALCALIVSHLHGHDNVTNQCI